MPFIITDPCIETKDTACVDVCRWTASTREKTSRVRAGDDAANPSGRVHRLWRVRARVSGGRHYESIDATPANQQDLVEANGVYRNGDADTMAKAEEIVRAHIAAQPALMAVPAPERQAAHATH